MTVYPGFEYDEAMPRSEALSGGSMAWEEAGSGDPPIVLLHGWCCDRTYLAPQQESFAADHRVIAVDLPGHGENDAPERDYGVTALSGDVIWLCHHLRLQRPVLIGHSLGGAIAISVGVQRPEHVGAVVALDTTIGPVPETRQAWRVLIDELSGPDFRAAARAAIARLYFLPTDDAARREKIIAAMTALPQHVMRDTFVGIAGWHSGMVSALQVPFLHIARSIGGTNHDHLRELCPHAFTGRVVASGHFVQLEVPDQVNAMIRRFLTLI